MIELSELQKIADYHRENSGGLIDLSMDGAAALLDRSGAPNADEYIRRSDAWIEAAAAEFESLPKIPRGHRLGDNASFGGWPPSGSQ